MKFFKIVDFEREEILKFFSFYENRWNVFKKSSLSLIDESID